MDKARFYSPTLGRFTQPDTLIPSADNPQAWNRFSYVMNSPILYNDPSGHRPVEDKGGGCVVKAGCSGDDERAEKEYKEEQRERRKAAQAEKRLEEKMSESPTMCNCSTPRGGTVDNGVGGGMPTFLYEGLDVLDLASELVSDMDLGKGFRAINPDPVADIYSGVVDQFLSDLDRYDLSPVQKIKRTFIAGAEAGLTGAISNIGTGLGFIAGETLFPEGGGIIGAPIGGLSTSLLVEENLEFANEEVWFPVLGLGNP